MSYLEVIYQHIGYRRGDYTHQLVDYLVQKELGLDHNHEEPLRQLRLLDVGSGMGHQAAAFSRYFQVSCLDRSDECQTLFSQLGLEVECETCDLQTERYPFPDQSFDIIFSKSVIEHLTDWQHFLQENRRLLKDDGTLVLMTPSWRSSFLSFYDDPTHVHPFTEKSLRDALTLSGFAEPEVKEVYQLPFVWRFGFLAWVPRLVSLLPDRLKWKDRAQRRQRVLVRFSKEKMLLSIARK